MHHPLACQIVQDAHMASLVIKLRQLCAKNVLTGSILDPKDQHHSAIASLVPLVRFGLRAAAHLVLLERTIPMLDLWIPMRVCCALRDTSADLDLVYAQHALQGPLRL
jgi:hypothetical protein